MSVIPSVYFLRPNVPHYLYWETELIPAISNVRMYKEPSSFGLGLGGTSIFQRAVSLCLTK
ncbi:hypothetical protein J41TS4_30470 [Paenibacillus apis]|uniref:Uncharacterized protein n=1 Tax=Paenibacillus apis TaxID=1792174 RepID=A0A919Y3V9_9BACL|nr:hypothetical protein J41TS4_30470 [Paenibacillus apis]